MPTRKTQSVPRKVLQALRSDQPKRKGKRARYQETTEELVCQWIAEAGITNKDALQRIHANGLKLSSATLGKWTNPRGINTKSRKSKRPPPSSRHSTVDHEDYARLKRMEVEFVAIKRQMLVKQLEGEASKAKKTLPHYLWSKISNDDNTRLTELLLPYYEEHHDS